MRQHTLILHPVSLGASISMTFQHTQIVNPISAGLLLLSPVFFSPWQNAAHSSFCILESQLKHKTALSKSPLIIPQLWAVLFAALLAGTPWWPLTLEVTIPKKQVSVKKLNVCLCSRHLPCSTFSPLPHFPQENLPIRLKSGQSQPFPPLLVIQGLAVCTASWKYSVIYRQSSTCCDILKVFLLSLNFLY